MNILYPILSIKCFVIIQSDLYFCKICFPSDSRKLIMVIHDTIWTILYFPNWCVLLVVTNEYRCIYMYVRVLLLFSLLMRECACFLCSIHTIFFWCLFTLLLSCCLVPIEIDLSWPLSFSTSLPICSLDFNLSHFEETKF